MHQAIPYRSWRLDLHNPTTHFTPQPLNLHSHNIDNNNKNNNLSSSSVSLLKKGLLTSSDHQNQGMVLSMVSENAVIVFGRRGCCMSHVVKRLLQGLGVNPAIYEVDETDEESVAKELEATIVNGDNNNIGDNNNNKMQFPAVFIGGKLFGGLDRVMATHISGELVPLLKEAGALWL